jgi:hypothetical protein
MKGLVVTRRDGERIMFKLKGEPIGYLTVVQSEVNRASLQLVFRDDIDIQRAELAQKGRKVDRYA